MNNREKSILKLVLALAYLTCWDENTDMRYGDEPVLRAWKGYDFKAMDQLKELGLIEHENRAKSLYLTEAGVAKAKKVLAELGLGG